MLAAASGEFGGMPFSQVLEIIAAYLLMFILFTIMAKPIVKLLQLAEDETLAFTRSVTYPNNGFVGIQLCTAVFGSLSVPCAAVYMFLFAIRSFRRDKKQNLGQQVKSFMTPLNLSTLTMLVIGCLLSGGLLIDVLKKPILYLITLLRCIVMPLIAAVLLCFSGWGDIVCLCSVLTRASLC